MKKIIELDIKDFEKCNNIWNMEKNKELKNRFYNELLNKNRMTFVYTNDEEYIGEDSDGKYVKLIKKL